MNRSVEIMLKRNENDLRKSLPHFAVDKVVGSNIDIFPQKSCSPKRSVRKFENPL